MIRDHDFAAAWHGCTERAPSHRGSAASDLAFWEEHASGYDESATAPGRYEQTLAAIQELVHPTDTLLDVGAGTGRFAIPLAPSVRAVTALDHAPPMLALLREKAERAGLRNVETVQAEWEHAAVPPHDVVLAAWSLYRLPDIREGMQKLVAATRRTLIVVASAGNSIRHDPLLSAVWGAKDASRTPLHLYFYGVLWQAGIHAELRIVQERELLTGDSPRHIAAQLAPAGAEDAEITRLSNLLLPQLQREGKRWLYEKHSPLGFLVWQRARAGRGESPAEQQDSVPFNPYI